MGVEVGERELLQVVEAATTQVERRAEGEPVGHGREGPLAGRRGGERPGDPGERGAQGGEVDLARAHHAVDRPAGEHGQRQRAHHDGDGEQGGRRERPAPPGKQTGHAADGAVRGARAAPARVLLAHRDTSSAVSWDSQISR